jgi:hypothetical protein
VVDFPPVHTIIKEVVKEADLAPPGWWKEANTRAEDILDRELRVGERSPAVRKVSIGENTTRLDVRPGSWNSLCMSYHSN